MQEYHDAADHAGLASQSTDADSTEEKVCEGALALRLPEPGQNRPTQKPSLKRQSNGNCTSHANAGPMDSRTRTLLCVL